MVIEKIISVELTSNNELSLEVESGGNPFYQYVYREAAGVTWINEEACFRSTPIVDWSAKDWFLQIVKVARSVSVSLVLSPNVSWINIDEQTIETIVGADAI